MLGSLLLSFSPLFLPTKKISFWFGVFESFFIYTYFKLYCPFLCVCDLSNAKSILSHSMPVNDSNLTDTQEKILSILPIIPALLSIAGSTAISCSVIQSQFAGPPYKRFLFGLSISDIVGSSAFMLQAFLVPQATSYRVWAIGNDTSCTTMGAMTQIGLAGSLLYNLSLSIWYVSTIKFGISTRTFCKYIEPGLHFMAIGFSLGTALYGTIVGVFHEFDIDLGCWVSDYPDGCDLDENDNLPCQSITIAYIFAAYPFFISFVIIFVNKVLIVLHVSKMTKPKKRKKPRSPQQRKPTATPPPPESIFYSEENNTEQQEGQQACLPDIISVALVDGDGTGDGDGDGDGNGGCAAASFPASVGTASNNLEMFGSCHDDNARSDHFISQQQQRRMDKVRSVAVQSFLYVGVFFLTFFWAGLTRILESMSVGLASEIGGINNEQMLFPLLVIHRILFPSIGVFNLLIFLRPQYIRIRTRNNKDLSRIAAFRQAFQDNIIDTEMLQKRGRRRTPRIYHDSSNRQEHQHRRQQGGRQQQQQQQQLSSQEGDHCGSGQQQSTNGYFRDTSISNWFQSSFMSSSLGLLSRESFQLDLSEKPAGEDQVQVEGGGKEQGGDDENKSNENKCGG